MGLLDKAVQTQSIKEKSEEILLDLPNRKTHENFLQELLSLKQSIDFAPQVFNYIIKQFEILKAAFLYINENREYYNLCSLGYDITTNNRLRLDKEVLQSSELSQLISSGKPFSFSPEKIALSKYFSKREYGLIEDFFCIPFAIDNETIGLLLITEFKSYEPDDWEEIFYDISKSLSYPLYKSRMILINTEAENSSSPGKDLSSFLSDYFDKNEKNDYYLIKLELSGLLNALSIEQDLTIANIKSEIVSVFKTMSGRDTEIQELPHNSILLIQKKDKIPDIELFIHQLTSSLPLIYSNLKSVPELNTTIQLYTPDSSLKDILKEFL